MYLIVGLGNPGPEYEETRHNVGFKAAEEVAGLLGIKELKQKQKMKALVGEGKVEDHKIIIAQPQTFMNLSGEAVSLILQWHKIPEENLIVIHDDADLEVGSIRVRPGGGSGGHHGIESIVSHIHTTDFKRIRIGIGRSGPDITEYVLQAFPKAEREDIGVAIKNAAEAALSIVKSGIESAMNNFNG